MTMRAQHLKNGMWQVVETDSDGQTFVFEEFSRKWQADEYIADCNEWEEAWEEMEDE